jgi:uncharacterized protein (DUF58 family)
MTAQAHLFWLLCLFVLAAAFQTQTGWLYLTGASGFGLLLVGWVIARWQLRRVRLEALPVQPCYQGGSAQLELAVVKDGAVPSMGLQVLRPSRRPHALFRLWRTSLVPRGWDAALAAEVALGRPGRAAFSLSAEKRGEFKLPLLLLQSAYPLGLIAVTRRLTPAGTYLVYPVGPRVAELPWLAPAGAAQGAQRLKDARQGQLIRGVREYRSGDAWREIHWRTTARLGAPHVRESEQEQGEMLVLFLDLRRSVHTEATLEHLVTVAASLVSHCQETGRPVRLMTQREAEPDRTAPTGFEEWAWLARAQAIAPDAPPDGEPGAVLLTPAYVPGWQAWASHLIYCPGTAANAMDATIYCPVGASIPQALSAERRP